MSAYSDLDFETRVQNTLGLIDEANKLPGWSAQMDGLLELIRLDTTAYATAIRRRRGLS